MSFLFYFFIREATSFRVHVKPALVRPSVENSKQFLMAVALSSPGVAFHLHSPALSSSSGVSANRFLFQNQNASPSLLSLPTRRPSRSVFLFARRKNRKGFVSSSSPKKNKKVSKSHNS